jgi:RNA polymerase sigma-70 factor (ECF subfamily)
VSQLPDNLLIIDLQKGDLEALCGLYDRHRHMVYRTALAITGDPETAADLLQDVFLRLHRFAHRVDPQRPLRPWLYRMTANMAYTWIKRRHRWNRFLQEMAARLSRETRASPHQQTEQNEEWKEVQMALDAISPEKRVVVVLYYLNDLSVQEIAEVLDLPIGTVKSRLHYGRLALKRYLGLEKEYASEVEYGTT